MKSGDTVQIRVKDTKAWSQANVLLASSNGESIVINGDSLPQPSGLMVHPLFGKVLCLAHISKDTYEDLFLGTHFEIKP